MYDFSFVKGLSKFHNTLSSVHPSTDLLDLVRDILEYEYCLLSEITIIQKQLLLKVKVPYHYSDTQIEWVWEVYKWHLPLGVSVQVYRGEKLC